VRLGASLHMGYFAQQIAGRFSIPISPSSNSCNRIFPQDGLGSLRSLAGAFQFSGEDVEKEDPRTLRWRKSRLAIARMLYNPPNFLVLDEPTNSPGSCDQGDAGRAP